MSHAIHQTTPPTLANRFSISVRKTGAKLLAAHRARATARLVGTLADEQVADCGIDRSKITGNVPVMEIERGLMDRLMNAR